MKITLIRFKRWGKSTKLDVKTKHFAILREKTIFCKKFQQKRGKLSKILLFRDFE